ncbi:MAG: aldo/keto reductase [Citrobacter freundii]|nr:MAG: aldo/keto reductase [Citrobacter freundii]
MKYVELMPGIRSSAIGFGCAPVMGAVSGNKAKIAIDAAIDAGVNHFDLARSYGYGDAEQFVGKLTKGRREQIVLASKFGIAVSGKAKLFRPLKPLIRLMNTKSKEHAASATPVAEHSLARFHFRVPANPEEMKKNLEISLRALKTDYLDYYFIHEPPVRLANIEELIAFSRELKKQGKIRAFGLACWRDQFSLHSDYLDRFDVLQFDLSPGAPGYEQTIRDRTSQSNIIFSPLKGGKKELTAGQKLSALKNDLPKSVILCSMFNLQHLATNTAIFK